MGEECCHVSMLCCLPFPRKATKMLCIKLLLDVTSKVHFDQPRHCAFTSKDLRSLETLEPWNGWRRLKSRPIPAIPVNPLQHVPKWQLLNSAHSRASSILCSISVSWAFFQAVTVSCVTIFKLLITASRQTVSNACISLAEGHGIELATLLPRIFVSTCVSKNDVAPEGHERVRPQIDIASTSLFPGTLINL